ncbi:hypothetical protein [Natrinema sp. H-ect4]|uniref:hypothetical protein n=1 Tax=Natrinema sp. H-ect4 TaxID=3242699 RepID=UPI0035A8495A
MADEGGKYYLDDVIHPANEDEIRKLHTLLGNWLERAERDFVEQEDEILAVHLYPLWQDLDIDGETHPVRHLFGERDDGEPDSERTPRAELIARREALICLLEDPQLREILMWVDEHPNRKIPKEKEQNGKGKRWEASRWLRSEYGLVEETGGFDHVYVLTRRGEAVRDALSKLSTSEAQAVADLDTEETFRTWLRLLNRRKARTE